MSFQNVVLGSPAPVNADGTSAVPRALLSTTHQNWATVGLIDAATPLAVFTADVAAQFRRYTGSGDLNDAASWTAPLDIGLAAYPKLAGGPNGLMLLAGDNKGGLFARKWNGSGFGPRVTIGPGSAPYAHLFQDAGGRLHAVFQRDSADPLHVIHAVSDDGTTWRSGTLATQDIATDGGIDSLRVATAADHIGVAVWHAGKGAGDIRVSAVGPDAPAPVTVNGSARADDLAGTRLADRLFGRAGNDRLRGLAGNDLLAGGPGNDLLIGGPGNDVLIGGPGRDSFIALAGNDTIDSRDGVAESVLCGPGRDTVRADRADRLIGCEVIRRA
jgi:Ca2+-binding RTX toxin-like protein